MEVFNTITPASIRTSALPFIKPVLVAIDLRIGSDKLVVWASEYANSINAPLAIVHIVHDPASAPGFYSNSPYAKQPLEPLEMVAERMMKSLLSKVMTEYPDRSCLRNVSAYLICGLPKTRIGEVAEKLNAQMLVIGREKQNALVRFLKGSITSYVVKKSNVEIAVI